MSGWAAYRGEEEDKLLQAEKALGQKLAFDMDAVKGRAPADEPTPAACASS
ncbi:MAG: hypothetical protein NTW21_00145 [Verrucomicrobia bacterium]|nr:hypothetical protein [Verrucomicrobiota bacterium]